jgi:type II secretory pathway component PulJ
VLLAMSILAVIMTVIYTSFSTASRSVESAEVVRDETDLARTLIARLSQDLENAYCGPVTIGSTVFYGKNEEVELDGIKRRHDSLALTTLTNWRKTGSKEIDLWEVGYYFKEKPDGNGYSFMRREKRELSTDFPPLEGGVEYEITDQVDALQLRYSNDGSNWVDVSGSKSPCTPTAIPAIVEMTLLLKSGKQYVTEARARHVQ